MPEEIPAEDLHRRVYILESDLSRLNDSHVELKEATVNLHKEMSTLVRSVDSLTSSINFMQKSLDRTDSLKSVVDAMKVNADTIPKLWEHVDSLRIKSSTNSVVVSAVKVVGTAIVVSGIGIALAFLFGGK